MNRERFTSMQNQLHPSGTARTALAEKLANTKRRTVPVGRYVAIAACAAIIVAAVPAYQAVQDHLKWQAILNHFQPDYRGEITEPHSYVLAGDTACWPEDTTVTEDTTAGASDEINTGQIIGWTRENSLTTGASDEDQNMTPGELTDNLLEAGFSQEDADAYLASGWQMTWAKWWKFYHLTEETSNRTLEALLDFSRTEGLAVNTGEAPVEMPGGAYVGDAPMQENAVMAYQNLMARFASDYGPDAYPEWYGGAYIDNSSDCLVVNIAEYAYHGADIKELYARIEDWASPGRVSFRSSGYHSLNYLRHLQAEAFDAMTELGLAVGCGVNEETGQVELTLPEVNDAALWKLAELDPAGTSILVIVNEAAVPTETPAVTYTTPSADNALSNEDNAIACEPQR